jgi:hypothetical protein
MVLLYVNFIMSTSKRDVAGVIGLILSVSIITSIQEPNFGLVALDNAEALGYNFANLFLPIIGLSLVIYSVKKTIKSEMLIKFLLGAGFLIALTLTVLLSLNGRYRTDETLTFDNLYEETGMYVIDTLVGQEVSYSLEYNASEWSISEESFNSDAEYELNSKNDSYAIFIAEKPNVGIDNLVSVAKSNLQEVSESFELIEEMMVSKDGTTFVDLIAKVRLDGTDFTYYNRYYAGDEGSIQAMTFTYSNLFDENRTNLKNLLDGIEINGSTTNEV